MNINDFIEKYLFLYIGDVELTTEQREKTNWYAYLAIVETVSLFPEYCFFAQTSVVTPEAEEAIIVLPAPIYKLWVGNIEMPVLPREDIVEKETRKKEGVIFGEKESGVVYNLGKKYFGEYVSLEYINTDSAFPEYSKVKADNFKNTLNFTASLLDLMGEKYLFYLASLFPSSDNTFRREKYNMYESKLLLEKQKYMMNQQIKKRNRYENGALITDDTKKTNKVELTLENEKQYKTYLNSLISAKQTYQTQLEDLRKAFLESL